MTLAEALEFSEELASGEYTLKQLDQLVKYLETAAPSDVEAFFAAYYQAIHELEEPGPVDAAFRDRLFSLYPGNDQSPGEDETSSERGRPTARLRAGRLMVGIAAMIALVAVGIWRWKAPAPSSTATAGAFIDRPSPISPGGNKAILTLANGRRIVLDSLQNGTLGLQGNSNLLKPASGRLIYQPENATDTGALAYNTITTPKGGQYEVTLPDGSRVWLNAASSLRFPTSFSEKERQVEMTGEVYFEVAKNREKPFKVRADGFQVRVLGTHFNVNAYTDEKASKTTLLEGSVNVSNGSGSSLLEPGQQAIIGGIGEPISILREADVEEAVAWKNGRLQFNNADIPSIMRQISRWYNVDIGYEGGIPPGHFTGAVPRNSSLARVLQIFSLSQIHFKIDSAHKKITVVS